MAKSAPLSVWLYGTQVATLTEPTPYRYRFDFSDEAMDRFGRNSRVLSLGIPFTGQPLTDRGASRAPVAAFLEGLLPEGNLRRHIASTLGVPSIDKLSILRSVGYECAGAVQFLPLDQAPTAGTVETLDRATLDDMVASLPTYRLPEGSTPQASLAGIQDKLLLVRTGDGWGWPTRGAHSTHIIKPAPLPGSQVVPGLVEAEDWALKVAARAGLAAAASELSDFGGRRAIVVTRYDRTAMGERHHQEDFCQALGLDPEAKYESTAEYTERGSRLQRLTRLAADRALSPTAFREELLAAVTFNVVIGNGDAHSKNYSVMIGDRGDVSLAPLYDSAPVMYIDPIFKGTGQVINGRTHLDWVSDEDLVAEAVSWGLARSRAEMVVRETMHRTWESAHGLPLPPECSGVLENLETAWRRRHWPR
jgi:serine/threonine-protein kinase HipA